LREATTSASAYRTVTVSTADVDAAAAQAGKKGRTLTNVAPGPMGEPRHGTRERLYPAGNGEGIHPMSQDRTLRGPLSLFRNMKTARKLLVGFLAVSLLMVGVGAIGITKLAAAQAGLEAMYRDSLQAMVWLGDVESDFESVRRQVLELALADPTAQAAIETKIVDLEVRIDENWAKYTATDMTGREVHRDAYIVAMADYRELREAQIIPLILAGKMAEFVELRDAQIVPLIDRVATSLTGLAEVEDSAATQALADSRAQNESARILIIGFVLAAFALSIGLAVGIGRMIARPLRKAVEVLEGLAEGRLDKQLDVDTKDEVGQMATALNRALAKLGSAIGAMGNNAQGLASSSEELSAVSAQMKGSAEDSAAKAGIVSAAAEQVSVNVQTVAASTEEMSASIREIAKNTISAADVAARAVQVALGASVTVGKLGESSAEIGSVVKVINQIAEQTNLLALNATIEAARAGEAGKGFAVVAGEVKELAQETSKATEVIARRIDAIQTDTKAAVAAIDEISAIIGQINDTQSTIASAIEEQTATTNEMARNVNEAATGSTEIASNITGIAMTATDTQTAASSTSEAAGELARMASELRELVGQFNW
jgi:methyl-accepting chemotaxis protein